MSAPLTVFLFPGQGGADALASVQRIDPEAVGTVRRVVEGEAARQWPDEPAEARPGAAQRAAFTAAVAGARVLGRRGVRPDMIVGQSFGELAAAVAAGVFTLAEGAAMVCRLVDVLRPREGDGAMAAVALQPEAAVSLIAACELDETVVACVNAPHQVVVAGPRGQVEQLVTAATGAGIAATVLPIPYLSHHPSLGALAREWEAAIASLRQRAPRVPLVSTTAGRAYGSDDDIHHGLAANLTDRSDLPATLRAAVGAAPARFVECAPPAGLDRAVRQVLVAAPVFSPFGTGDWPTATRPDWRGSHGRTIEHGERARDVRPRHARSKAKRSDS